MGKPATGTDAAGARKPTAAPLRLLVLEPDPSHGGGSEAVILSLARGLAARGHAVGLLHESQGSMLPDYSAFVVEQVRIRLPGFSFRAPFATAGAVLGIARAAVRFRADAILSSHLGFLRHCALVRTFTRIPSCFHLGLPLTASMASLRIALPRVGHGIAPSLHTLQTWHAGGWPVDALDAVPNWVDPVRFRPVDDVPALRAELGLPTDGRLLVFVGRVCEQKGVDVLLRAFARLAPGHEDVTLVVAGGVAGDYRATLEATLGQLDDAVRRRIVLVPVTAVPEKYYAAGDVACAPSISDEAFGLTILEAMASAVPVVTTPVGIIPDIVGDDDHALLAPAGDPDALAERLEFWLGPTAPRDACGARLRARVQRGFGPDASVDAYEAVLAGLARR